MMNVEEELRNAQLNEVEIRNLFSKWKRKKSQQIDAVFESAHDRVFDEINCLACANCCKTTSPIFRDIDIKRISKSLRMKEHDFQSTYLRFDEDKDWVLKQSPCAFLCEDHSCSIYENRPQACREYPHTNRKKMYQILDLTAKNRLICPAVTRIVDEVATKLT